MLTLTPDRSEYIAYPKKENTKYTVFDPTRYDRGLVVDEKPQTPKKRLAEDSDNKVKRKRTEYETTLTTPKTDFQSIRSTQITTANQSSSASGTIPAITSMSTVTQSFNTEGTFSNSTVESKFKE